MALKPASVVNAEIDNEAHIKQSPSNTNSDSLAFWNLMNAWYSHGFTWQPLDFI